MDIKKVNILIVDDRKENLLALEAVLTSPSYNLIKANSGEEALKWILREEFAVVLMDVQMPGLNGFDTAKIIRNREKSKNVPIIFITALSQTFENVLQGYSVGAIDYILKPFDPIILKYKVEGFVSIYLNRKEIQEQKEIIAKHTKELEKAYVNLQKSEALSKAIGASSIDTIITLNEFGEILSLNPAVADMFNYAGSELYGESISDLLPTVSDLNCIPKRTLIETEARRKDGSRFPVDIHILSTELEEECIYVCSIRDISEKKNQYDLLEKLVKERTKELIDTNGKLHKEIEDKKTTLWELKNSQQRYKSLFENHPDAVFSCDLKGNCISHNNQMMVLTGRESNELSESLLELLVHKDNQEDTIHYFKKSILKEKPQSYETRILHKNGQIIHVQVTYIPIIVDKEVIGVYGIAKDISLEKKLWNQLFESDEKYRQLVEDAPVAIIVRKVISNRWTFINKTGLELLGAKHKDQIIGKNLFDFIHPDDHEMVKLNSNKIQQGQKIDRFEERFVKLTGEVIHVEVSVIPFVYEGEPALHILVRDITELKQSREFIQQTEKLTVVGELAAGIAHEIRNPLTSLRGFTQLLEFKLGSDTEYVDIMISEIDRINTIVGELLLLAKPNKLDFKEVDLHKLLYDVITLMNAQANLHGVEIKLEVDDLSKLEIHGVENKLKQVFINILKNAIEAMPDGGKITISTKFQKKDFLEIEFKDQGMGIPQDLLPKLGQPFCTTKEKGTGLGLMVCYSIIESHQGMMKIDSEEGKGTSVEISLPFIYKN